MSGNSSFSLSSSLKNGALLAAGVPAPPAGAAAAAPPGKG